MASLYDVVLKKKQANSQITCNPTLDVFDLDYCKILDSLVTTDLFIADKVRDCMKELRLAGGIDYNGHYRSAYEAYNEAITYYVLKQRGQIVHHIPEASEPTPDFEVEFSYLNWEKKIVQSKVYIEVKSLGFADGNNEYKRAQEEALQCNIQIENQIKEGRRICTSDYSICPLSNKDKGPTSEIEEFNKKINNNIKEEQFRYGNGEDSVLYVDFGQYMCTFKDEECLPVYPNIIKRYSASGRLWMLAFGKEGERIFTWPEFDGKGNIDSDLMMPGILNSFDYIKGIIFSFGCKQGEKRLYGFYRYEDQDSEVAIFIHKVCDFYNDDQNSYGYEYYKALEGELKKRYNSSFD